MASRDAIWQHRSRSTLVQAMACCLTAPSHYLNQCWLIISEAFSYSLEGNFTGNPNISILDIIMKGTKPNLLTANEFISFFWDDWPVNEIVSCPAFQSTQCSLQPCYKKKSCALLFLGAMKPQVASQAVSPHRAILMWQRISHHVWATQNNTWCISSESFVHNELN